jgi:hypothetical protein
MSYRPSQGDAVVPIKIATRGPPAGECNICGVYGPLTQDHTPPKGCIGVGQVEMNHIVSQLSAEKQDRKGRFSQNGIKYRTLCRRCNNSLLGAKYDLALRSFVNTVGTYLKTTLHLPAQMSVNGQPQQIMRAVLGHIAAQGVGRYQKGPDTEPLRDYFLDGAAPLPDWINVYYWTYPYQEQVVVRDCAYLDLRINKPFVIWLLKFFPVAFLVSWNEPSEHHFELTNLAQWRAAPLEESVELFVQLRPALHQWWPEAPTEHSVVVYGQEGLVATGRS